MEFYTYQFFVNESTHSGLSKYIILIVLLAILLATVLVSFKSKQKMKYRDLIILVSLAIVFLVGIQIHEYNIGKNNKNNSEHMINFLDNISAKQLKEPKEISVNSKYVKDEMLVKMDDKYYQVNMNADLSAFTLEETYLMNAQNVIIVEE